MSGLTRPLQIILNILSPDSIDKFTLQIAGEIIIPEILCA
jgi:hypothetical protein